MNIPAGQLRFNLFAFFCLLSYTIVISAWGAASTAAADVVWQNASLFDLLETPHCPFIAQWVRICY